MAKSDAGIWLCDRACENAATQTERPACLGEHLDTDLVVHKVRANDEVPVFAAEVLFGGLCISACGVRLFDGRIFAV